MIGENPQIAHIRKSSYPKLTGQASLEKSTKIPHTKKFLSKKTVTDDDDAEKAL